MVMTESGTRVRGCDITHWRFPVVMWKYRSHYGSEQLWRRMFQIKKTVLQPEHVRIMACCVTDKQSKPRKMSWPGADEILTIPPCNLALPVGYTTRTNHSCHVHFVVLLVECPLNAQWKVCFLYKIRNFLPSFYSFFLSSLFRRSVIILNVFEYRPEHLGVMGLQ